MWFIVLKKMRCGVVLMLMTTTLNVSGPSFYAAAHFAARDVAAAQFNISKDVATPFDVSAPQMKVTANVAAMQVTAASIHITRYVQACQITGDRLYIARERTVDRQCRIRQVSVSQHRTAYIDCND
jgi:hypothetical protein